MLRQSYNNINIEDKGQMQFINFKKNWELTKTEIIDYA